MSKSNDRAKIAKQKFLDSIHDIARRHELQALISPQTSYFSFIDGAVYVPPTPLVQQPMMMVGSPQAMMMTSPFQTMPPPGEEMYQQQPVYAVPSDLIAKAPMMQPGYPPQPQNGMHEAPPIETYDPTNANDGLE